MAANLPPNAPPGMPADIPEKPDASKFAKPVAWLFGRQLIANLKWILLYTAFKGKLDARDWMNARIVPDVRSSSEVEESRSSINGDELKKVEEFWQQTHGDERESLYRPKEEFWFDYIADSGDGQKAVYSIAYLCMSDLALKKDADGIYQVEFIAQPDREKLEADGSLFLPRGAFLFVGGDTSYHIADYANLADRFQNPFCWAALDLFKIEGASSVMSSRYNLLFGIPGNHDYYDALDGFNRQFRRPALGRGMPKNWRRPPLLVLPTFRRLQEASYVALRLPFGWWLWGMDTEEGEIDYRQEDFFTSLKKEYEIERLIVATPEPTTVFGKFATEDENQSKTFQALGLERPFLKNHEPIGKGKCRLDLSGDVHHYARYFSELREGEEGTNNYASVVSGGGGAFFHPSHTTIKEVEPEKIYPPMEVSRSKVADELFKITNIFKGGYVWLFGFFIAFLLFFAASIPQSSMDAIDSFPPFTKLGISTGLKPLDPSESFVKQMPRNPWWTSEQPAPHPGYWMAMIATILSLVLISAALAYSFKRLQKKYDPTWQPQNNNLAGKQRVILWVLGFGSFVSLVYGILGFHANDESLTSFGHSLIIFAGLLWSVLAIITSVKYSEWLFGAVYHGNLKAWHYWPVWVLNIMALLGFSSALWFFGKQESANLISDIGLVILVLLIGVGLIVFAYSTGGDLKKGAGKFAFLLLGVSHAIVQLFVPFLLVRKGHLLWAPLAALILVFVFKYIGRALAKNKNGWPLAIAWIIFCALLLVIPFIIDPKILPRFLNAESINAGIINVGRGRMEQFLLCFYAGAIGALMSCVLFGWYLAVALAFNGHNNEAGGAARIEGFKEFIRFHLTREGLTGYVIGIDEPGTKGVNLKPKVVDVFRISSPALKQSAERKET
ncbi:MAG TPA: Yip1 family protein [Pyrinomonadaceae bacterium]